jgi:tetrahydromethanopterin S-methyltransferase subunit B
MNISQRILLLLLLFSTFTIQAQQLSIDDQFKDLIKKSNNYQDYKVVKKEKIYKLRENVSDSISILKENIVTISSEIEKQKSDINSLTVELDATKSELTISQGKENGIYVLGILTKKSTYTFLVFFTLGILLLIIVFLFIKYKSGFDIIKTTKSKLDETDEEFQSFRQRSLEREQQIRRKLQDEINKKKL